MNYRSTTPAHLTRTHVGIALIVSLSCAAFFMYTSVVGAEQSTETRIELLDREIKRLGEKTQTDSEASESAKKRLNELKRQRDALSSQLEKTSQDLETMTKRIAELSTQLETRRDVLGELMVKQRINGSISPIEMLMSSHSIADYFDRAAYQASLRDSLNRSVVAVKRLSGELKEKQALVKKEQASQQAALAGVGSDISTTEGRLVVLDGRGAHMTKLTAELARKKQRLQQEQQQFMQDQMGGAQQVAPGTIARSEPEQVASEPKKPSSLKPVVSEQPAQPSPPASVPPPPTTTPKPPAPKPEPKPKPVALPNGGYPAYLNNCYVDSYALSYGIDPWGYGCRQCVSYVAWKMKQKTKKAPMYWGNAKQWPKSATDRQYKTNKKPRDGSIGVMTTGYYGHVVWVEKVNDNGTINISQYNYWLAGKPNGGWGYYSEFKNVSPKAYQIYIYV